MSRQECIRRTLLDLGVPQHIKGYQYLRTGIDLVIEYPEKVHAITKALYPEIAKAHGTTMSRVERAIRHAIECTFDRISPDKIEKYFGYSIDSYRGKPTNSHFICAVAEAVEAETKD